MCMFLRSGAHEELQRANGEDNTNEEDQQGGQQDSDKVKKPARVHRYSWMHPDDNNLTVPMFIIAYEELYNADLTEVTCIRVWKFIFDSSHSDSELCRKLMDENRDTFANSGVAHAPNRSRRKQLVAEQKENRRQMGGLRGAHSLEYFSGMQYAGIINEQIWFERLLSYSGKGVHNDGRPFFDESKLPKGVNNKRVRRDPTYGGTHPFSPEYVFNAKRDMAFRAGTVSLEDNKPLDIHPDFLNVNNYWTSRGSFVMPDVHKKNEGFFFMTSPFICNIFDVSLPRRIYGSAYAGPHLLGLFKERFPDVIQAAGGTKDAITYCFNNMMSQKDQAILDMERQMAETVITYDSIEATDGDRKGLRHYGEVDASNSYIIEPRQSLKAIAQDTRRVYSELIQPWLKSRDELRTSKHLEIVMATEADDNESDHAPPHDGTESMDCDYYGTAMEELRAIDEETTKKHFEVTRDLVRLHLNRMEDAFRSKVEREAIPPGYLAMFDGLQKELLSMPNNTASVAFAHNRSLQFDDISSFAHIFGWIGAFFEQDCFIEGRDRRILDELFLHLFEQYGDVTFLLLLCGTKGNGKSLRTERAMWVFPENWVTSGGSSSARAGMNGTSDSVNGKNVIYDEMIDELCDADGSDRLEYWKQIVCAP